jgi:hypothetical protein
LTNKLSAAKDEFIKLRDDSKKQVKIICVYTNIICESKLNVFLKELKSQVEIDSLKESLTNTNQNIKLLEINHQQNVSNIQIEFLKSENELKLQVAFFF